MPWGEICRLKHSEIDHRCDRIEERLDRIEERQENSTATGMHTLTDENERLRGDLTWVKRTVVGVVIGLASSGVIALLTHLLGKK